MRMHRPLLVFSLLAAAPALAYALPLQGGPGASAQTAAQAPPPVQAAPVAPSPDLLGIAHIALRVHSLADSVAFYEKLGFAKAFELSRDGAVYEAFIKINDRQFIELYPTDAKNPEPGFLHLCFYGANLQAVHDFYVQRGLKPIAVRTAGAGNLLFTMPGPMTAQGPQNMEYTQYMPGSLHSRDLGKNLGASRISTALTGVTIAADDPALAKQFYVDKAGFKLWNKPAVDAVSIPGGDGSIGFAPVAELGQKARFTLGLGQKTPAVAKAMLRERGVPVEQDALGDPVLHDPDGNEIDLRGPHVY